MLVPISIAGLLAGLCLAHSPQTPLWTDEVFSVYPLTDVSLPHMFSICRDTLNTAPPLYFLAGRFFARVFGSDATTLRLFSSLAFGCAAVVLWRALKPRYGVACATVGTCAAFLTPVLLTQNEQIRFYGLYFLLVAVALERFARAAQTPEQNAVVVFVGNAVVHLALLFTHTFGVFYGACLLITMFLSRRRSRLFLPYCCGVLTAWGVFGATWGTVAVSQQAAFRGYTWIPKPLPDIVLQTLFPGFGFVLCAVAVALLCCARAAWNRSRTPADVSPVHHDPLALAGLLFVLFPTTLVYIISLCSTSCFLDRYLLPQLLGWAVLISAGINHATREGDIPESARAGVRYLGGFLAAAWLVAPSWQSMWAGLPLGSSPAFTNPAEETEALLSRLGAPPDVPVIHTDPHTFVATCFYDPRRPARHVYVVDDDEALRTARAGDGWQYSSNRNMVALGRGYLPDNVMTAADLVRKHARFLVIDQRNGWASTRFAGKSGYTMKRLSVATKRALPVYLVERNDTYQKK